MDNLIKLIQDLEIKSNAENEILVKIKSCYQELVMLLPLEDSIEKKMRSAFKNLNQKDSDIVKFNVDGTYFYTLKSTIARKFQKPTITRKFKNEIITEFYKPNLLEEFFNQSLQNNNAILLRNRSPIYFQYILNYLRCPEDLNEIFEDIQRKGYSFKTLRTEAEYFKVESLVEKLPECILENMHSNILSQFEFINLLELCKFDLNSRWKQIYKASRDGFLAANFHAKCDGQSNTLTIIKSTNGNVFGGFTTKPWSQINNYVNDSDAFIFSLINSKKAPKKFDCKSPQNAIRCQSGYGPTFGSYDIYICDSSNTIQSSSSNLFISYKNDQLNLTNGTEEARSFLAGSYNFVTSEIEVYQRT